jgi:hypothetical protein
MADQRINMMLPSEIQRLVDETLDLVRSHPQHEMGQQQRRKIYAALWASPKGNRASRWLAVLSARRVQPIYEDEMVARPYNRESEVQLVDRMLMLAEQVASGIVSWEEFKRRQANDEIEDFYHNCLIAAQEPLPGYVWLVALAAENALNEALGLRPFETLLSGEVTDEAGITIITDSDTWSDPQLAGAGMHADDASLDAAYGYGRMTSHDTYDVARVLDFWEWWLTDALQQAWQLASEDPK